MVKEKLKPDKDWCLPDKKNFWARAGLSLHQQPLSPELIIKANRLYLLALDYIDPLIHTITASVDFFPDSLIPDSFKNIKNLTVFASSLGRRLDDLIEEFSERNQALEVLFLDAWGSESLETLNRNYDHHLREKYGSGTRRFSPGYGSVSLLLNSFIVRELLQIPEQEIEVLGSGVMLPRKTTTCLIGWYDGKK